MAKKIKAMKKTIIALLIIVITTAANAQYITQTLTINPGWNAIYLTVQPKSGEETWGTIFANPDITSVWAWETNGSGIQFLQDPDELEPLSEQWRAWIRDKPLLTDLYAATGGRAYLVKSNATGILNVNIEGSPVLPRITWQANSFNLVGFHVDGAGNGKPLFTNFFENSAPHKGHEIYQLVDNHWQKLEHPDTTEINPGEAYWVYCKTSSDFTGPLNLELEQGESVDYGTALLEQSVKFSHLVDQSTVTILRSGENMLNYWVDPSQSQEAGWKALPASLQVQTRQHDATTLRLGIDRSGLGTAVTYRGMLTISDAYGMIFQVPYSAEGVDRSGLWIGTATIKQVQEPGGSLTDTATPFEFRLIMHVDNSGVVTLLHEVTQMKDSVSGDLVLVVNSDKLSQYTGITERQGQSIGRRISSINFTSNKKMGTGFGGLISTEIIIPANDPLNPYRHKYHPDHDNLDNRFETYKAESFDITRTITFNFQSTDPELPSGASLGWGSTRLGGFYEETVDILRNETTTVKGTFSLTRVSSISTLVE